MRPAGAAACRAVTVAAQAATPATRATTRIVMRDSPEEPSQYDPLSARFVTRRRFLNGGVPSPPHHATASRRSLGEGGCTPPSVLRCAGARAADSTPAAPYAVLASGRPVLDDPFRHPAALRVQQVGQ